MRKVRIAPDEYYHVFNRGAGKQTIFHDSDDYYRFLFLILYFQSLESFPQLNRLVREFVRHSVLDSAQEIIKKRQIELTAFCIMPNHFHLLLKETEESAISAYMHKVLNAYGKYYNTKYEKTGHVFQGPYKAVLIESNEQLLHVSAYIHRNPCELNSLKDGYLEYPWSSCQDLIAENRWDGLLISNIVLDQFKNRIGYRKFLETSTAKTLESD